VYQAYVKSVGGSRTSLKYVKLEFGEGNTHSFLSTAEKSKIKLAHIVDIRKEK